MSKRIRLETDPLSLVRIVDDFNKSKGLEYPNSVICRLAFTPYRDQHFPGAFHDDQNNCGLPSNPDEAGKPSATKKKLLTQQEIRLASVH